DRTDLKQFIHDVYFQYIEYALSRNFMNFSFMMMFAFALLCEDHSLREKVSFEYIMIDEFQDTNEIQFKLSLLLSKNGNICVVGDWKQSIFSFQYASVENIKRFEKRLKEFKEDLNTDETRVSFPAEVQDEIKLKKNFRSTQQIIDFSENALLAKATENEVLDKDSIKSKITKLEAVDNEGPTEISSYVGENENEVILTKITDIVDNEDYLIQDGDTLRKIQYSDIAVLVRTRKSGLELLNKAEEEKVPVAYEGGIELFRRPPALLLLAWLRIVQNLHSKRGWSVILDRAGYNIDEIDKLFDEKYYPDEMYSFRRSLKDEQTIGSFAKKVFDKYSMNDAFTDKIIEVLQTTYDNTYLNRENLIDFIVDNIEAKETYEVDSSTEEDVFKIQTIHSAKGLEYPVVIIADITLGGGGFGNTIDFTEPIGLRQKKIFSEEEYSYSYDNWKKHVMSKCLTGDYDEERRLLYVAMTRTENYLLLTAEKGKGSNFFSDLAREPELIEPDINPSLPRSEDRLELVVDTASKKAPVKYSAHSIVDVSDEGKTGLGPEYGTKVHNFAEMYISGDKVQPSNVDEENLKNYIDTLKGELLTEEVCLLPVDIDQRKFLFNGVIDLINIDGDTVKIVDYKTDRDLSSKKEYFKQISIYYHAVKGAYPKRNVNAFLFYTEDGTEVPVDPLTLDEIIDLVMKDR
ncbi:MAG: 3'-5' exonuclease, partial [Candidatus Saliniplasma sp.]